MADCSSSKVVSRGEMPETESWRIAREGVAGMERAEVLSRKTEGSRSLHSALSGGLPDEVTKDKVGRSPNN
jgi:hypothetical protein